MHSVLLAVALFCVVIAGGNALEHPPVHAAGGSRDAVSPSDHGEYHLADSLRAFSTRVGQSKHRRLAKFIPQDYSEFAHLAEYLTVKLGGANAKAEELAKIKEEEAERAGVNGLAFSLSSSADGEAEARRKALRAYGVGSEEGSDTPTVTTAPPATTPPRPEVKSLLESIEW